MVEELLTPRLDPIDEWCERGHCRAVTAISTGKLVGLIQLLQRIHDRVEADRFTRPWRHAKRWHGFYRAGMAGALMLFSGGFAPALAQEIPNDFSAIVREKLPAVVTITTRQITQDQTTSNEFLDRFDSRGPGVLSAQLGSRSSFWRHLQAMLIKSRRNRGDRQSGGTSCDLAVTMANSHIALRAGLPA
ncbi:hypothetical protein [Mesorhizobium sp. B2-1-3A]|uniref:hypothetical protein n=1 Tax=Mesorhizobium sp. B2-1-3A TaxID=2589971 RepID=UPI0032B2A1FE